MYIAKIEVLHPSMPPNTILEIELSFLGQRTWQKRMSLRHTYEAPIWQTETPNVLADKAKIKIESLGYYFGVGYMTRIYFKGILFQLMRDYKETGEHSENLIFVL